MARLLLAKFDMRLVWIAGGLLGFLLTQPAVAQQPQTDPPPAAEFEEQTGRRLGDIPNDQIRQFRLRRACEQNLPECPPHIRAQLEQERKNRLYMSSMIIGVFVLVILLMIRASQQKQKQNKRLAQDFKNIGHRVKKYKGAAPPDEDEDEHKDQDPGDNLRGGVR